MNARTTHPYDYAYRPGMSLRPAPPAADVPRDAAFESLLPSRRRLTPPWREFEVEPPATPYTRLIADHRWQGDELMDAVVQMFQRVGPAVGRRMLEQALDHGIQSVDDAPDELVALFRQLDCIPDWHDPETYERGRQILMRASTFAKAAEFLSNVVLTSLLSEVSAATGATGRFRRDPLRRNLETYTFFHDVTRRGGMERFSDTFKDTVRVRLMHAQVRAALNRAWGEERYAQAGNPISAAAQAAVITLFGQAPLLYDIGFGRPWSRADLDAAVLHWGYIGYICGVAEEIIPKDADQAYELGTYMAATSTPRSAWSEELSASFVEYFVDLADTFGVRGRVLGRSVVLPLIFGLLTEVLGERLMREFLAGSDYRDAPLRRWAVMATALARAEAQALRAIDAVPLGARIRSVPSIDPSYRLGMVLHRNYSRRKAGPTSTPYDSHDHTRARDIAAHSGRDDESARSVG